MKGEEEVRNCEESLLGELGVAERGWLTESVPAAVAIAVLPAVGGLAHPIDA